MMFDMKHLEQTQQQRLAVELVYQSQLILVCIEVFLNQQQQR